uniref:Uncharacterized protein n=1 Tax=Canis lupus familiaris TaxID=9615 RepID=A0A8C0NEU7_CANLF
MCSEMGSRGTGMQLLALAIMTIIANLLLYFPNGRVLEPAQITDLFWFFHGLLGAGLLVRMRLSYFASHKAIMLSCTHLPRAWLMLFPVLLAMQGTMEAVYHVAISLLGLLCGPFCDTGSGTYTYPFRHNTMEDNLFNQPTWATCQEPEHIIFWNDLLSILLGISVLETMLCLLQVASGLCNIFCGTCVGKGQVDCTIIE